MKNKISACILAAALALPVAAQELRSTYFMQTSNNRHEMNPALLDSSYVSMPLFMGNLNIGSTGNFGLANFVYKMQPGWQGYGVDNRNLTTFMHPSVDAADFLGDLKDNNRMSLNFKYGLAAVAFKAFKGTNIVELNLRSNTNVNLPKQLFAFMKEAGKNESYEISDIGIRTENFLEIGLGHSHKINDKITVGGKMKFLLGIAYADFSADNLHVQMQGDQWAISGQPKLSAAILKSEFTHENNNPSGKIDGIDDVTFGLPGFGLAFDLGATYKVLDDLTISAAITGLIFGFMLYGKKVSLLRVVLAKLIHTLLVGMLLNSFWLSMLYGNAFPLVFLGRLPKELVMFPIQTAMIYILLKAFEKAKVGKLAGLATE